MKKIIKYLTPKRMIFSLAAATVICGLIAARPYIIELVAPQALETAVSTKKLPIYCVDTGTQKKVAISFDAAWGADDTDELLTILKNNDVKATFFLCGYWVDKYPDEVKKIYNDGHDIGNHSNTHPHSSQLSLEENKQNIMQAHNKVKELLGIDMALYRPPFGEYNDTVLNAAEECGYYAIQWDVDSLDWKEYGVQDEIDRVLNHKNLGNGSIILFHNDAKYTPDALDSIIKGLKEKGYEIVPVSELIYKDNYYMNHEGRQIYRSEETTAEE